jgi:hypothetical protein
MYEIHLTRKVYDQAKKRAVAKGFDSIEAYIADVVHHDNQPQMIPLTETQLKKIAQAESDIDAGKGLGQREVEDRLATFRQKWLDKSSS